MAAPSRSRTCVDLICHAILAAWWLHGGKCTDLASGATFQVVAAALKYALPLMFGVILALVLKNTEEEWYDRYSSH